MALLADRHSDLLIDGKLVSGSAGIFPTINPATEEVLGTAADANADDMSRASMRPGGRSTTPTGPAPPNFGCDACVSCAPRCATTSKSCGPSRSPKREPRGC
jgi:hypothetical protein